MSGSTQSYSWSEWATPCVAMRMYASLRLAERHPVVHNLVVSNVPGPAVPLYFLGARIRAMYPLGPIFHGVGLNVTVMSLSGALDVGVLACPELVPDLWALVDGFPSALEELENAR